MKKSRKIVLGVLIVSVVIAVVAFAIFNLNGTFFEETSKINKWIEGEKLNTRVTDIVITKELSDGVKSKEGYSFVCIKYDIKNTTDSAVEWKDFPLLTLATYDSDEPLTKAKKEYATNDIDKEALKEYSYIMGVDLSAEFMPIEKGKIKEDLEVYQVSDKQLENTNLYITFDIYKVGIKVEEGLSELPNLKKTLKQNKKKIEKKIENQTIEQVEEENTDSSN